MNRAPTPASVIDGYARGLVEVAKAEGDVDGIADQIFRIAAAVESSEPLRDALTDPRIPVDRKQGIVDERDAKALKAEICAKLERLRDPAFPDKVPIHKAYDSAKVGEGPYRIVRLRGTGAEIAGL